MRPGDPRDFAVVLATGLATLVLGLALWLGPLAYGIVVLGAATPAGAIVTALGAAWALLHVRDGTLPGMLAGAVHSILIFARLVRDPWEGER